jgi:hypothetical protein
LGLPNLEQIDRVLAFRGEFSDRNKSYASSEMGDVMYMVWNSREVESLIEALYDNDFVLADFDWGSWDEGRERGEDRSWIANLDLQTLCQLFTAHTRNDRFCGGHLAKLCREGVVHAMLERLADLRQSGACG